jgi:hypothetical protein
MFKPKITSFITCLLIGLSALLASPSYAGEDDDEEDDEDETEVVAATSAATQKPAQAGALQNNIRRSREQTTLFERSNERYADYNKFKDQLEENYGLSYSFNLSYRSRWQRPADIGRSDQILFWPSLNWDMFDSERFGTGSSSFCISANAATVGRFASILATRHAASTSRLTATRSAN